jgi:SET domain-containing protein
MVLGYGMLYNHQDKPNTKWVFNFKNLLGDVVAVKPIKAGEEIFVSYGPNYFKNRNKVTV